MGVEKVDPIGVELGRQDEINSRRKKSFYYDLQDAADGETWFDEWPVPKDISETDKKFAAAFADTAGKMIGGQNSYAIAIHRERLFRMLCNLIVSLRATTPATPPASQDQAT